MNTSLQVLDNVAESVNLELKKHEITEEMLVSLVDECKGLTVKGPDDREGLKKVREARVTLKYKRVEIEKIAKGLRDNANNFNKAVRAREIELISIIEPTEESLQAEEKRVADQAEALRQEAERKTAEKLQSRIDTLNKFGYVYDLLELQLMGEDRYNDIVKQADYEWREEQRILAEGRAAKQKADAEESERVRLERLELDKQRAEQEARERELQRIESERIEATRKEQEAIRLEREKLEEEKRAIEVAKEKERIRVKFLGENRGRALTSYGYHHIGEDLGLMDGDVFEGLLIHKRQLFEEEQRRIAVEKAESERIENERLIKVEHERQAALRPDKEKLIAYANALQYHLEDNMVFNSKEAAMIIGNASVFVKDAILLIKSEVSKL